MRVSSHSTGSVQTAMGMLWKGFTYWKGAGLDTVGSLLTPRAILTCSTAAQQSAALFPKQQMVTALQTKPESPALYRRPLRVVPSLLLQVPCSHLLLSVPPSMNTFWHFSIPLLFLLSWPLHIQCCISLGFSKRRAEAKIQVGVV